MVWLKETSARCRDETLLIVLCMRCNMYVHPLWVKVCFPHISTKDMNQFFARKLDSTITSDKVPHIKQYEKHSFLRTCQNTMFSSRTSVSHRSSYCLPKTTHRLVAVRVAHQPNDLDRLGTHNILNVFHDAYEQFPIRRSPWRSQCSLTTTNSALKFQELQDRASVKFLLLYLSKWKLYVCWKRLWNGPVV